jgi:hypothetical protein
VVLQKNAEGIIGMDGLALNEGDDGNALDLLQSIYRDLRVPLPVRMRAAMAAIPFESPKLAVTSLVIDGSFADRLDRAVARSKEPNRMNRVIEHQPIEEKSE